MLFAIITLLTALALAGVAGWFSIIGVMAILAGAPVHALVAGVTIEVAKLVTTSWIYRNWNFADWKLRILLMFFTVLIMLVTSMGVFGFLSKAHIEQGASTVDNAAKVERLDQQIAREKTVIESAEKTVSQLDATLDSYLGKDRADRSVVIRKRQESQRTELSNTIDAANKRIDTYSDEKFGLQAAVRQLQIEVGPIRYISELIFDNAESSEKNTESAVRVFILLIVLSLDPLAVTLLIAANSTLLRLKNEKEKRQVGNVRASPPEVVDTEADKEGGEGLDHELAPENHLQEDTDKSYPAAEEDTSVHQEIHLSLTPIDVPLQEEEHVTVSPESNPLPITAPPVLDTVPRPDFTPLPVLANNVALPVIRSPELTRVSDSPWMHQQHILDEIIGNGGNGHYIPQKLNEEETTKQTGASKKVSVPSNDALHTEGTAKGEGNTEMVQMVTPPTSRNVYPKTLGWLNEFKGHKK